MRLRFLTLWACLVACSTLTASAEAGPVRKAAKRTGHLVARVASAPVRLLLHRGRHQHERGGGCSDCGCAR